MYHFDLYGKRSQKYDFLNMNNLSSINWESIQFDNKNFFFTPIDFKQKKEYDIGFSVSDIFNLYNAGLATEFDAFVIKNSLKETEVLLDDLKSKNENEIMLKYNLDAKKSSKVKNAINDIKSNKSLITSIDYRPFDSKYTIYTGASNGIMGRPRNGVMKHMLRDNLALLTCRQQTSFDFQHVFLSTKISERCSVSLQTGEVNYIFPLYLYPDPTDQPTFDQPTERTPNLNPEIVREIEKGLGLTFVPEKEESNLCFTNNNDELRDEFKQTFAPIDLLDYIYAVLHSPSYREKYKEFLKIDFPRVPYPQDVDTFWKLVHLGGQIREIHLLESPIVRKYITGYPKEGNNEITTSIARKDWEITDEEKQLGRIWINETQYFDNIPLSAWEFYIGGYQPAQKWLKDRRGRTLGVDDIMHYQKIIVALTETERLMGEVDNILENEE